MKEAISTPDAPKAIGPYSPAIRAAGMVFVSGQVPIDPATGNLITGDIRAQTERVMKNWRAILDAAGSGLEPLRKQEVHTRMRRAGELLVLRRAFTGRRFTFQRRLVTL